MFIAFLFPLIKFPGMPVTRLPETPRIQIDKETGKVQGREPFYGDEIDYLKPSLSKFEFLCFPLTKESPGVYDIDFCLPYFPEEDISAKTQIVLDRD